MDGWAEALKEFRTEFREALSALTRSRGPEYDSPRPVVLARVEDDRSDFPKEQRIQRELFAELVKSYDPDRRTAPVVVGFFDANAPAAGADTDRTIAGPSHWVGEYLPPLGIIRGEDGPQDWHLDHDHLNLFGNVRQIIDSSDGLGRIDKVVARGFVQRSIAFIPATNETGGKPDLWHFAVLGGEQPGIPNMPSLARTFGLEAGKRSSEWKSLGLTARALAEVNYRTLSILDAIHPEDEMNAEDRAALMKGIGEAVAAAVAPVVETINRSVETQSKAIVDLGSKLETKVATVETKVDDEAKRAAAKAKADRAKSIVDRQAALVKSGRVTPAVLQRATASWDENTADETKEAALASLEALPAQDRNGRTPTEVRVKDAAPVLVDFEQRYRTDGAGMGELNPVEVEVMSGLMAGVMHLPVEQRKGALNAAIISHYDGPAAGHHGF